MFGKRNLSQKNKPIQLSNSQVLVLDSTRMLIRDYFQLDPDWAPSWLKMDLLSGEISSFPLRDAYGNGDSWIKSTNWKMANFSTWNRRRKMYNASRTVQVKGTVLVPEISKEPLGVECELTLLRHPFLEQRSWFPSFAKLLIGGVMSSPIEYGFNFDVRCASGVNYPVPVKIQLP